MLGAHATSGPSQRAGLLSAGTWQRIVKEKLCKFDDFGTNLSNFLEPLVWVLHSLCIELKHIKLRKKTVFLIHKYIFEIKYLQKGN